MLGKVTDAVTAIATTQKHHSQILTRHFELLEKILETQHNYGYRIECNRWQAYAHREAHGACEDKAVS